MPLGGGDRRGSAHWMRQSMEKDSAMWTGFLMRLGRSQAGNTLAIVAAALIPLAGMIGGGVDMSRLYLAKTRLQQACDAGALAGRKAMGGGSWSANSNAANTAAVNMFNANFASGAFGSSSLSQSYSESGGTVTGTASAVMPMTIMRVFGQSSVTMSVNCSAEMRIPNTDVMFVLDTTGSMAWNIPGDTTTKIVGLRTAVKCFYEALAKIKTDASCGSSPSGSNNPSVQLRFGFVPYSTNVNVGYLLPNSYFANNWTYQSRTRDPLLSYTNSSSTGSWTYVSGSAVPSSPKNQSSCPSSVYTTVPGTPTVSNSTAADGTITTSTTYTQTTNGYQISNCSGSGNKIKYDRTDYTNYVESKTDTTTQTPNWSYQPVSLNVSGLKAGGSSWNTSVNLPIGRGNTMVNVNWNGCIEERQTVRNTDGDPSDEFSPIPAAAYDLNIDMVPSTSDVTTQWGPSLPDAVWGRYTSSTSNRSYANVVTATDLYHNVNTAYCPVAARKLQSYPSASTFDAYVDSLTPSGNTYHDIGILWGARLMSPTGIFASENAYTPSGGQIQRHMIFMTDGDTNTDIYDVNAYGVPWWDRRQTSTSSAPTSTLTDAEVNARFPALCAAVKNMNITLWVISYGAVSGDTATRLQNCASPGRYYAASSSTDLISQFQQIANKISDLRLTQ